MSDTRLAVCGLCSQACLIDATVDNGRIVCVQKAQRPHVKSALCVKGAALKQFVHHPDRLTQPLKRVGPKGSRASFVPVSWDEAIADIAARLLQTREESGAKATVFFAGHPKWFRRALGDLSAYYGSPNYCSESSCCNRAHAMAWNLVFGCNPRPDVARCKTLLIWSQNPAYSRDGSLAQLRGVQARGGQVVVVDPRVTPTAAAADIPILGPTARWRWPWQTSSSPKGSMTGTMWNETASALRNTGRQPRSIRPKGPRRSAAFRQICSSARPTRSPAAGCRSSFPAAPLSTASAAYRMNAPSPCSRL